MKKRTSPARMLRLAQAHRPIFYLPHLVADAVGAFRTRSLALEVVPMRTSGQWHALTAGEADIAIGGPMRAMRLFEGGRHLVTFAAAVAASPWILAGAPKSEPIDDPRQLSGRTVLDDEEIATARLCLRGLTASGSDGSSVEFALSSQGELLRQLAAGTNNPALAPFEAVASLVDRGAATILAELGDWTGPLPWSAYQALPAAMSQHQTEIAAFVDAISESLQIIAEEPVARLARLVAAWFPDVDERMLQAVLLRYRGMAVWPVAPGISRDDFERFGALLVAAGWLRAMPSYAGLVRSWDHLM